MKAQAIVVTATTKVAREQLLLQVVRQLQLKAMVTIELSEHQVTIHLILTATVMIPLLLKVVKLMFVNDL